MKDVIVILLNNSIVEINRVIYQMIPFIIF